MTWDQVAALGSLLSGLGLLAAAASLWYIARQTRASERVAETSVYQTIVALGYSTNETMISEPDLYFEVFPDDGARQHAIPIEIRDVADVRVEFVVRKWLDYIDMVMVLMDSIPASQRSSWQMWARDMLEKSPRMRGAVITTEWWPDHLKEIANSVEERLGPLSDPNSSSRVSPPR